RIASDTIRCGIVEPDFHGAGTTNEFILLQPKDRNDLAWLWHQLNSCEHLHNYITSKARGAGRRRIHTDDLLRMPMIRPAESVVKQAEQKLRRARILLAEILDFRGTYPDSVG